MQQLWETALAVLPVFGIQSFRAQQGDIVLAAMSGYDVFVRLPTGGGKSLCFQVPAVALTGTTVVISPLLSLMEDQVAKLKLCGVSCVLYSGMVHDDERQRIHCDLPRMKLLYTTPEQLAQRSSRLVRKLQSMHRQQGIQRIVLDEAHCVLSWGETFRYDSPL
jgi:bloom syndrome protein